MGKVDMFFFVFIAKQKTGVQTKQRTFFAQWNKYLLHIFLTVDLKNIY